MKTLWFIRGVSGAGKSTTASALAASLSDAVKVEADDFRVEDGKYVYHENKNFFVHKSCRDEVRRLMSCGVTNVIVSNTSTTARDVRKYKGYAEDAGYRFMSLVVEKYHENENLHDVPEESLEKMETQLRNSLKFR